MTDEGPSRPHGPGHGDRGSSLPGRRPWGSPHQFWAFPEPKPRGRPLMWVGLLLTRPWAPGPGPPPASPGRAPAGPHRRWVGRPAATCLSLLPPTGGAVCGRRRLLGLGFRPSPSSVWVLMEPRPHGHSLWTGDRPAPEGRPHLRPHPTPTTAAPSPRGVLLVGLRPGAGPQPEACPLWGGGVVRLASGVQGPGGAAPGLGASAPRPPDGRHHLGWRPPWDP